MLVMLVAGVFQLYSLKYHMYRPHHYVRAYQRIQSTHCSFIKHLLPSSEIVQKFSDSWSLIFCPSKNGPKMFLNHQLIS